ncbi:MAG: methionine synthase [Alistipes sp.]|nr:methionine synthase [Alistipes sp.]
MNRLRDILSKRIVLLDGAMGTMIQRHNLQEEDFRGEEFSSHEVRLAGNNDMLVLTRPDIISAIHREYLEAGADIIETCTFNAQRISQQEYHTTAQVRRINLAAAHLARAEAERMSALTPDKPRFVAGSVGPTGRTLSMSPDVDNPAYRALDFDSLKEAYVEQMGALVEGGVDLLLVETVFDTLNAKAALDAAQTVFEQRGVRLPIMLSVTVADRSGRTLSGQTLEALLASVAHVDLLSVGLNCSFGAEQMMPHLRTLSDIAPCYISAYPNAGLPDEMGRYDQTPQMMAEHVREFAEAGVVNIVGGCCGSTPDHIRAMAESLEGVAPRTPSAGRVPWLAGLEGFVTNGAFVNVGERCNVAGSRKFLRLIKEGSYNEALAIAAAQVRDGAMVLDVNMDDAMLDAEQQMCHFLRLMASDPEIARLPWMVDSSRFEVIESALKNIQGKAIVNSLSLKEGERLFVERARRVRSLGAALVVMAFDEQGQATTYERKIEVCERAYRLLTEQVGFPAEDIIFDPNVLTVATGMAEHDAYALDFIRATRWIHENLPSARVSGGVSNLSFSLRGNNYLREAMHAVFLYHAIDAGLDMAIVNPSASVMYEDIPQPLREALEDVVLCRRGDATERLLAMAEHYRADVAASEGKPTENRADIAVEERLAQALQRGDTTFLEEDIREALQSYSSPSAIIEGPLMRGMTTVGELFGQGKMFLPQVVKTARTMKCAVSLLQPYIEASQTTEGAATNGRYLLATVKGDVHDIGKNIAGVVLSCNGFQVIDLGVMVPAQEIVKAAVEQQVDYIGLSGLITPSLEEMCNTARALQKAGVRVPLFISGATTSALHTALKIAPLYDGGVFHVKDASQNPVLALQLASAERERVLCCNRYEQERLRREYAERREMSATDSHAEAHRKQIDWYAESLVRPTFEGVRTIERIEVGEVLPYINWIHFCNLWGVRHDSAQGADMRREAEQMLSRIAAKHCLVARVGLFEAYGTDTAIVVRHTKGCPCCGGGSAQTVIPTPRQLRPSSDGEALALCDFVAPEGFGDHVGAFAVTLSRSFVEELEQLKRSGEQYESLLMQSLGDRLVEAASEWLHERVRKQLWGYAPTEHLTPKQLFAAAYQGIRPAVGYPSLPEQRTIFPVAELLDVSRIGISLTENGAMYPQSSVCGLYIASAHARYFVL